MDSLEEKVEELTKVVYSLQQDIKLILRIFEQANRQMHEDHINALKLPHKLDELAEQNKIIAVALLGIAKSLEKRADYPLR